MIAWPTGWLVEALRSTTALMAWACYLVSLQLLKCLGLRAVAPLNKFIRSVQRSDCYSYRVRFTWGLSQNIMAAAPARQAHLDEAIIGSMCPAGPNLVKVPYGYRYHHSRSRFAQEDASFASRVTLDSSGCG